MRYQSGSPIPTAASFHALNVMLAQRCLPRQAEHAGRHATTIAERLVADIEALRVLPAVPLEPCEKRAARVTGALLDRLTHQVTILTMNGDS